MRALVYTGPETLEMQDRADLKAGTGENLIRVDAVGICGSDMHAYLGHDDRRPAPLILGHEAAGLVVEGPMAGQRVAVNPLVTCGKCSFCHEGRENLCVDRQIISMEPRQGAFAQQLVMPSRNLVPVPDTVCDDHAALAEPLAVCWHGVRLGRNALFGTLEQARCLVQGGGAIGLGSALALQAMGARDITVAEPNTKRHGVLVNAGDFAVSDPADVSGSFDLIVDCVGISYTRRAASKLAKPGGVIVHIGLGDAEEGIDTRRITLQEITFIGTYTYTAQDFRDTAQGIFDGIFGALDWVEHRPLSEGAAAFADILAGQVAAPKVILHPH
ncbi:alcohol dehydrogenase catalytic domain-containing protein [Neptunicoccus cionae]|uniref:alcohol dehydrogenase catalytic domain-containing protein n=1 Tax=Neptunicoccus cionae TaxID=2035344 RepID=UPI000C758295|nr:alcohol dehydrogenase catalytic domain-containing protein [Amylibacter cionae]PLS21839.1 galactitol-1-phosphate 5-dehydrogenase [Amylibacter cionae]